MIDLEIAGVRTVYAGSRQLANGEVAVMLRYIEGGIGSKDIIGRSSTPLRRGAELHPERVTAQTVADLGQVVQSLREARLNVGDFQFILDRQGRVFVNDPTGLTPNSRPAGDLLSIVDRFNGIYRRNAAGGN